MSTATQHLLCCRRIDEQAGPDISRLAPHLQQEWDHQANADSGSMTITPQGQGKV